MVFMNGVQTLAHSALCEYLFWKLVVCLGHKFRLACFAIRLAAQGTAMGVEVRREVIAQEQV